jgi:hypothetical protein
MKNRLPDLCYSRLPSTKEVIIIKLGESQYYKTDCPKETDIDELNEVLEVTETQRKCMELGSMFGWSLPGANPDNYINGKFVSKKNRPENNKLQELKQELKKLIKESTYCEFYICYCNYRIEKNVLYYQDTRFTMDYELYNIDELKDELDVLELINFIKRK